MENVLHFPTGAVHRPLTRRLAGRFGTFAIMAEDIEFRPEWVQAVMARCIVISAVWTPAAKAIIYLAISEQFDALPGGHMAPGYFWRSGAVPCAERL